MTQQETLVNPDTTSEGEETSSKRSTNLRSRWGKPKHSTTSKPTNSMASFGAVEDLSTVTESLSGDQAHSVKPRAVQTTPTPKTSVEENNAGVQESAEAPTASSATDVTASEETKCSNPCDCAEETARPLEARLKPEVTAKNADQSDVPNTNGSINSSEHNRNRNRSSNSFKTESSSSQPKQAAREDGDDARYNDRPTRSKRPPRERKQETESNKKRPHSETWIPSREETFTEVKPKIEQASQSTGIFARIKRIVKSWFGGSKTQSIDELKTPNKRNNSRNSRSRDDRPKNQHRHPRNDRHDPRGDSGEHTPRPPRKRGGRRRGGNRGGKTTSAPSNENTTE